MKYFRSFGMGAWFALLSLTSLVPSLAATANPVNLFIETNGVALSQFPSRSRLSASVLIGLTGKHGAVGWVAASDKPWLTASHSGRTNEFLTLTANPAGLKKDRTYLATVTVRTGDFGPQESTATITVSLWVGSADPKLLTVSAQAVAMAANPVLPWVYVSAGSSVNVFNVYDGTQIATFQYVAPTVGQLVVSSDGSQLFAVDTTNYKIIELNAATGQILKTFALQGVISSDFSFAYARPTGVATLFAGGQAAIDVATGARASAPLSPYPFGFYDPLIRATPDGSLLAIVERGLDPGTLYSYRVVRLSSGRLSIQLLNSVSIEGENCQSMAMNNTGSMVYPACGWPYQFDVYDAQTLQQIQTLPAVPYPDNAVMDSDGDFVGGVDGLYEADDVYVYDPAGYSLGVVPTTGYSYNAGQGANLMATSGDSLRVISATNAVYDSSQTLMFRNLP